MSDMTIVEGLKKLKLLETKVQDTQRKLQDASCELDYEGKPFKYGSKEEHQAHVDSMLKSATDMVQEMEKIQLRIAKTNIETNVTIEIGGNNLTKPIASWIRRRHKLSSMDATTYAILTDKGLQPKPYHIDGDKDKAYVANPIKFYNQKKRDEKMETYQNEAAVIDGKLEVVNAVTPLAAID